MGLRKGISLEKLEGAEELLNLLGKVKESVSSVSETSDKKSEKERSLSLRLFFFYQYGSGDSCSSSAAVNIFRFQHIV